MLTIPRPVLVCQQAGRIFQFRSKLGNPWQFFFHQFHVKYDRMCLKHDATTLSLQLSTILKQLPQYLRFFFKKYLRRRIAHRRATFMHDHGEDLDYFLQIEG